MTAGPMRVLIVERDVAMARLLRHILTLLGHEVCGAAASLDQALDQIQDLRPDLLTVEPDLDAPGDGADLAIRAYWNWGIRSLFIGSRIERRMLDETAGIEAVGYLQKPVSAADLRAALAKVPAP